MDKRPSRRRTPSVHSMSIMTAGTTNTGGSVLWSHRTRQALRWWAIWLRIVAISLSAVTAAKGAFDTLAGVDNSCVLLTFTAIGIITTIVLGIETAFKFEKRSAELGALGSKIATAHRKLETNWLALAANKDDTARFEQKRDLLQRDDEAISELYAESPAAGFNLQEAYIAKYHPYLLERYVPEVRRPLVQTPAPAAHRNASAPRSRTPSR